MRKKYHLKDDGTPIECKAQKRGCPKRSEDNGPAEHYDSFAQAKIAGERMNAEKYNAFSTITNDPLGQRRNTSIFAEGASVAHSVRQKIGEVMVNFDNTPYKFSEFAQEIHDDYHEIITSADKVSQELKLSHHVKNSMNTLKKDYDRMVELAHEVDDYEKSMSEDGEIFVDTSDGIPESILRESASDYHERNREELYDTLESMRSELNRLPKAIDKAWDRQEKISQRERETVRPGQEIRTDATADYTEDEMYPGSRSAFDDGWSDDDFSHMEWDYLQGQEE